MRLANFIDDMSKDFRYAARARCATVLVHCGRDSHACARNRSKHHDRHVFPDAVLLKSLPVKDPERLLFMNAVAAPRRPTKPFPSAVSDRLSAEDTVFVGVSASPGGNQSSGDNWTRGRQPFRRGRRGPRLGGCFDVLGVRGVVGRQLAPDDDRAQAITRS